MIIRTMGVLDIPSVIPILLAAYGRPVRDHGALERSLRRPTHHAIIAVDGDEPLGTVTAEIYDDVAYIGGMGVAPAAQRCGIGTALLAQLLADMQTRGVRTFLLDATAEGESLYRRHDFLPCGSVDTWERLGRNAVAPQTIPPIDAATFEEVIALDAAIFGASRSALLTDYAGEARGIFRARSTDGFLAGAAFVRGMIVGPWVAYAPRAAAAVFDLALAATGSPTRVVFVPSENQEAAAILADRGFSQGRRLLHMRRGEPHPVQRTRMYGQASLGTG